MTKSREAILLNERITRIDRGWLEPTVEGKTVVTNAADEHDLEPNQILPQDLYDFYNLVFHQGLEFRGYLYLLRNRGADISTLEPIINQLTPFLQDGLENILTKNFEDALEVFQQVDGLVTRFQVAMREIAHTVGIEIDPITGMISRYQGGVPRALTRPRPAARHLALRDQQPPALGEGEIIDINPIDPDDEQAHGDLIIQGAHQFEGMLARKLEPKTAFNPSVLLRLVSQTSEQKPPIIQSNRQIRAPQTSLNRLNPIGLSLRRGQFRSSILTRGILK